MTSRWWSQHFKPTATCKCYLSTVILSPRILMDYRCLKTNQKQKCSPKNTAFGKFFSNYFSNIFGGTPPLDGRKPLLGFSRIPFRSNLDLDCQISYQSLHQLDRSSQILFPILTHMTQEKGSCHPTI